MTARRYVPALGYDLLTSLYDPVVALTTRERTFKRRLLLQAEIADGADVLDLGCGTGTLTVWIAQQAPRARVRGLDGDAKVLSVAGRKAQVADVRIQFDLGLSFDLPYPDASFDRVLSSLLLHHLVRNDKVRTLEETYRVLKPGGELHVADWGKPRNALMKVLFGSIRLLDGLERTRDNVRGLLPRLFAESGFEGVSLRGEVQTLCGTLALYSAHRPA